MLVEPFPAHVSDKVRELVIGLGVYLHLYNNSKSGYSIIFVVFKKGILTRQYSATDMTDVSKIGYIFSIRCRLTFNVNIKL